VSAFQKISYILVIGPVLRVELSLSSEEMGCGEGHPSQVLKELQRRNCPSPVFDLKMVHFGVF